MVRIGDIDAHYDTPFTNTNVTQMEWLRKRLNKLAWNSFLSNKQERIFLYNIYTTEDIKFNIIHGFCSLNIISHSKLQRIACYG